MTPQLKKQLMANWENFITKNPIYDSNKFYFKVGRQQDVLISMDRGGNGTIVRLEVYKQKQPMSHIGIVTLSPLL